ncbi:MAG: 3-methyl-2-oxobutanoate hydroxymethyltransferase, partial [Thiobacillus sp.]|nr:3-methyl-2-oxobutanoate hydroxymethyltransferase [Thiobacillus sp.]
TIGIGAGAASSRQVVVVFDKLGLYPRAPKFSKNFLAGADGIETAVRAYVAAVKDGSFPAAEHSF